MKETVVHPRFIEQLKQLLPTTQVEAFLEVCQHPLKKSITIAQSRISPRQLIQSTKPWGRKLTPTHFTEKSVTYYIDREDTSTALGSTFLHQAGFFYIQEVAASLPAHCVDLQGGELVLDIAAAPGGKSMQLAQQLLTKQDPGLVVANDINPKRLKSLMHNLNQGNCRNSCITKLNGFSFGKILPNVFDHVLVDAPCSGEGTAYKSDFALKHRNQAEINKMAGTQFQLLISAIKAVKPGGSVIYSTCTINPYENETLVARVLEHFGDCVELIAVPTLDTAPGLIDKDAQSGHTPIETEKVTRLRPHLHHTGGFFIAKIRKLTDHTIKADTYSPRKQPQHKFTVDMSKGLQRKVSSFLSESFGIAIDPTRHLFVATTRQIYLTSPGFQQVHPELVYEKVGIPVLKIDRDLLRPTHYLGSIFGDQATRQFITLDDEQMQCYSQGEELLIDQIDCSHLNATLPYFIIKRHTFGMSVGKIVKGRIKNKFLK